MLPQRIAELKFSPDYLATLRKGLTDLISRGLTWRQAWPHLASGYSYLAPMLAAVCTRQIQDGETDITTLQSAVIALRLGREDHDYKEPIQQLKKLLEKLPPPSREAREGPLAKNVQFFIRWPTDSKWCKRWFLGTANSCRYRSSYPRKNHDAPCCAMWYMARHQ